MKDAIIGLVVDRSGSMFSMWDEAVAGINTFKNEQAAEDGTAWIILNYFDNEFGQKYDAWDAKDIPDLTTTDDEIYPRGMTALVDATVQTIKDVDKWLSDNDWFDGKPFVVVVTDGHENASKTPAIELKGLVEEREKAGWEFIYLAANVDLESTRLAYGFGANTSMVYDQHSMVAAYHGTSNAITRSRQGGDASLVDSQQ